MDHYLDIRLRPDPEFAPHLLMSALFSKLHRALVQRRSRNIGVSFPDMQAQAPSLGPCLRLHGSLAELDALMAETWLTGMRDHTEYGDPEPVPNRALHRWVRRVQAKSSPERIRRRLIRRHDLSEQDALARVPDGAAERLSLPFVQVQSRSTGQHFRLFIEHSPPQDSPAPGGFNTYGLSQGATVPWF